MAKEDDGNKHDEQAMQSLLKVSVFSRPKMFDICIQKVRQNITCSGNLMNIITLNKTCNGNRMLYKQRRLFSRKCTVKIHQVMVNNA